jgi:hypothetical protein
VQPIVRKLRIYRIEASVARRKCLDRFVSLDGPVTLSASQIKQYFRDENCDDLALPSDIRGR